jgi:hypothetical protein
MTSLLLDGKKELTTGLTFQKPSSASSSQENKKKHSPNDILRIKNPKHLETVELDLNSPLLRTACTNLGVDVKELESK